MNAFSHISRNINYMITVGIFTISLCMTNAHAQIVDTEAIVNNSNTQQERDRIKNSLNRESVKIKLLELGVNPAELQGRINSLTDAETLTLAQNIDSLPAGGAGTVTWILIILLIVLLV